SIYSPFKALTNASTVPSPPSESGNFLIFANGSRFLTPRSMDFATSNVDALPLNESVAIIIFNLPLPIQLTFRKRFLYLGIHYKRDSGYKSMFHVTKTGKKKAI